MGFKADADFARFVSMCSDSGIVSDPTGQPDQRIAARAAAV